MFTIQLFMATHDTPLTFGFTNAHEAGEVFEGLRLRIKNPNAEPVVLADNFGHELVIGDVKNISHIVMTDADEDAKLGELIQRRQMAAQQRTQQAAHLRNLS